MGKFKTGCLGIIALVVVAGVIGSCMGGGGKEKPAAQTTSSSASSGTKQQKEVVYQDADINAMLADLKDNAAKAQKTYKDQNLKIMNGTLSNIDADGKYISLEGTGSSGSLIHVQAFVRSKDKETKNKILNLKKGQSLTVYGHVKDVGEVMGYSVDIDKIE